MAQKLFLVILGAAIGVVAGYLISKDKPVEAPPDADPAHLEERIAELERKGVMEEARLKEVMEQLTAARGLLDAERARSSNLEETIAELNKAAAGPEPEVVDPTKPPTYDELKKAIGSFGAHFQAHMMGTAGKEEAKLTALLQRADDATFKKIMKEFDDATDINRKLFYGHILGLSQRPEAIKHLEEIVSDQEKSMMDRRMASHGLAFSGAEGLDPSLRKYAEEDPDRGVRANSAFGLYRRGNPAGVDLYFRAADDAFEAKDPMATAYVGGLMIMDERALPAARERLTKYKDWQARVLIIEYIKGQKDRDSLGTLRALADDEEENASVRKAAAGAIKAIEQSE
jgi:HEAT repeat protein